MSHFHILVVFIFALLVGPAAGSAELNGGRSPSTRRALSLSHRCKFISLAELQALPFWQTFYDRLSVVIFGHLVEKTIFTSAGFKLRTTFEVYSQFLDICFAHALPLGWLAGCKVCSERVDFYNIGGHVYAILRRRVLIELSLRWNRNGWEPLFPPASPTRINGCLTRYAEVGSLTGGTIYETFFTVRDVTSTKIDGIPVEPRTYTVNGVYPDTVGSRRVRFEVDANGEYYTSVISSATPGGICSLRYHNTTCIQEATGEAAFNLYGAVQVVFDSPVNKFYFWYLSLDEWVTWTKRGEPWSYSQSQATITTTGNDNSVTAVECRYS
ncbi:hypothetical protein B0H16DRAFT_1465026 [Mycena metata]|uniref:Uncharacterized protein n=1 Tax=Mycena metata TaxID=1033252 RepID=A0AAD7IEG5_9AGAR|nr:hypothetical protein B0H16DRAFT_1465026 [Mycena metata]